MDYARALVEHPKWRWEPGMVSRGGGAVIGNNSSQKPGHVPDINHPATKGWLLAMLRKALGVADQHTMCTEAGRWGVYFNGRWNGWSATEGEALAAALLAVWGTP